MNNRNNIKNTKEKHFEHIPQYTCPGFGLWISKTSLNQIDTYVAKTTIQQAIVLRCAFKQINHISNVTKTVAITALYQATGAGIAVVSVRTNFNTMT